MHLLTAFIFGIANFLTPTANPVLPVIVHHVAPTSFTIDSVKVGVISPPQKSLTKKIVPKSRKVGSAVTVDANMVTDVNLLSNQEDVNFQQSGKYFHTSPKVFSDVLVTYHIDDYVKWNGEGKEDRGYIIELTRADGMRKAIATGILSASLSHDWQFIATTSPITQ